MKSIKDRYWKRPLPFIQTDLLGEQAKKFKIAPEIVQLLHNRGIKNTEQIKSFLYPTLQDLSSPSSMSGISEAAEIIYGIIENDGDIIIWGDYDVDGVTATSLLVLFFRNITQNIKWFIPNRFTHGYGLHRQELKEIIEKCEAKNIVLITVDCGISSHHEIQLARTMGCKVIVTDHHEPGDIPVEADVIINPKQKNCSFKDENLSGVGLAFYLAAGIRSLYRSKRNPLSQVSDINLKKYLDLVAIGTIADMVSLQGCNRILVKAGFEIINSKPNPGIAALMAECDIRSGNINAEDIGFQIAPKINAAGRLAEASLAVKLFLENDEKACRKIAKKLTKLNNIRKEECRNCLESTLSNVDIAKCKRDNCYVGVVDYSLGILGIVASQIAGKIHVPVIIVAEAKDRKYGKVLKGSCRSVFGINIFEILEQCSSHLLQFGGHEMAAGITLLPGNINEFTKTFSQKVSEIAGNIVIERSIDIELELEKSLSTKTIKDLQLLEPFGIDNEKPKFLDKNIIISDLRRIGSNGDHLVFRHRGKYSNNKCVAFGFGEYENMLKEKPYFDVIYTVSLSRFKKAENWQAHLIDII